MVSGEIAYSLQTSWNGVLFIAICTQMVKFKKRKQTNSVRFQCHICYFISSFTSILDNGTKINIPQSDPAYELCDLFASFNFSFLAVAYLLLLYNWIAVYKAPIRPRKYKYSFIVFSVGVVLGSFTSNLLTCISTRPGFKGNQQALGTAAGALFGIACILSVFCTAIGFLIYGIKIIRQLRVGRRLTTIEYDPVVYKVTKQCIMLSGTLVGVLLLVGILAVLVSLGLLDVPLEDTFASLCALGCTCVLMYTSTPKEDQKTDSEPLDRQASSTV